MGGLPPTSTALRFGEVLGSAVGERLGSAGFFPDLDGFMQMNPQVRVDLSQACSPLASSSQSAYWNSAAACYDMNLGGQRRPLTRGVKAEGGTPMSRKRQASETPSEFDPSTTEQEDDEPKAKRPRRKVTVPTTDASGRPLPKEEIRKAKRRITNRESARRMRQERQIKAEDTERKLKYLEENNAHLLQQNSILQEEKQKLREMLAQAVAINEQQQRQWQGVHGHIPAPVSPTRMPLPGLLMSLPAALPDVPSSNFLPLEPCPSSGDMTNLLACATDEQTLLDFPLEPLNFD